jgi:hypothetical protein
MSTIVSIPPGVRGLIEVRKALRRNGTKRYTAAIVKIIFASVRRSFLSSEIIFTLAPFFLLYA